MNIENPVERKIENNPTNQPIKKRISIGTIFFYIFILIYLVSLYFAALVPEGTGGVSGVDILQPSIWIFAVFITTAFFFSFFERLSAVANYSKYLLMVGTGLVSLSILSFAGAGDGSYFLWLPILACIFFISIGLLLGIIALVKNRKDHENKTKQGNLFFRTLILLLPIFIIFLLSFTWPQLSKKLTQKAFDKKTSAKVCRNVIYESDRTVFDDNRTRFSLPQSFKCFEIVDGSTDKSFVIYYFTDKKIQLKINYNKFLPKDAINFFNSSKSYNNLYQYQESFGDLSTSGELKIDVKGEQYIGFSVVPMQDSTMSNEITKDDISKIFDEILKTFSEFKK